MPSVHEDVEQLEISCTADGDINWEKTWDNSLAVFTKAECMYTPEILLLDVYLRETCTYSHQMTYTRISILAAFITAPNWKLPKYLSTVEWINKFYILFMLFLF